MSEVLKIQEVNLDLKRVTSQQKSLQPLKVMDTGNVFVIKLTDDGAPVDLTGTRVLAVFSRGDGKTAQQDDSNGIEVEGNIITIRLRNGSYTDGQNNCEIQVYSGENGETLVTSARFSFDGVRGIVNDETVEAEDAFPILVELIKEVETANGQAQEAVAAADDAVRRADEAVEKAEGVVETLGDMTQKVYDTNHNGIVDDAERLGGQLPSHYATSSALAEEAAERMAISPSTIGATWGKKRTATLSSSGWISLSQAVTVQGVTAANDIFVAYDPISSTVVEEWAKAGVYASAQTTNSVTFTCKKVPAINLPVNIMILEGVTE